MANGSVWWETFDDPDKPIDEYTADEIEASGKVLGCRYLTSRGLKVVEQEWHSKYHGTIDIIAREGSGDLVLMNVKTRAMTGPDEDRSVPELEPSIDELRNLGDLMLEYLVEHGPTSAHLDLMSIALRSKDSASVRHLVDLFSFESPWLDGERA